MNPSLKDHARTLPPPSEGIFSGIANAFNSLRRVFSDVFRLFTLEIRRAGLTFAWMVALGAIAAMLIVTAWLGLMGALALWAVSQGWTWIGAIIAIASANFLAAAIAIFSCVTVSRNLLFPATQRQLDVPSTRSNKT